jgi:hypothetical protein
MRLNTFILNCFENLNLCHSNLFRISTCPPLPEMPAHQVNALSGVGPDSGIYAALQQAGIRISDFPGSDKRIKYNHFYDISFCQFGIQNL